MSSSVSNWGSLESGTLHTFMGTITGAAGSHHIEATDTLRGGGPTDSLTGDQAVAGDQTVGQTSQVADFSNSHLHRERRHARPISCRLQTRPTQPDGSATFNAVWDGQNVAGTLAYDDAGNVHMTFSGDNGTCDANITGIPGAFQIDGNLALGDTTLPVTGSQIA